MTDLVSTYLSCVASLALLGLRVVVAEGVEVAVGDLKEVIASRQKLKRRREEGGGRHDDQSINHTLMAKTRTQ